MNVEDLLYIYGAVCVSMIIFNVIYNITLSRRGSSLEKRCQKIKKQLDVQLKIIENNGKVSENHLKYLWRILRHINYLAAFDRVLYELLPEQNEVKKEYIRQIKPVIMYMSTLYLKKESIQMSYFAYFLSRCEIRNRQQFDTNQDILLEYVKKDNLYCRCNALQALYNFGDEEHIAQALIVQDDGRVFLHEKILTEGLLSFSGEHSVLIRRLWSEFEDFSIHTQLAILNYIRFYSGDYKKEMLAIMLNKDMDKELRLSAVRYFGKYYYEPALNTLLAFTMDKNQDKWEYATVATSSLSIYDGEEVIEALKEALCSSNWFIRYSAAQSLTSHKIDYSDLTDIVSGNDRYAREMMTYRLESQKLQNAEV